MNRQPAAGRFPEHDRGATPAWHRSVFFVKTDRPPRDDDSRQTGGEQDPGAIVIEIKITCVGPDYLPLARQQFPAILRKRTDRAEGNGSRMEKLFASQPILLAHRPREPDEPVFGKLGRPHGKTLSQEFLMTIKNVVANHDFPERTRRPAETT